MLQEEYKILDKMHRQKVAEVEKLGQAVCELEEALLSGAAAANAVRDYQRQVSELKVFVHTYHSDLFNLSDLILKIFFLSGLLGTNWSSYALCCLQGEKKTLERTLSRAMVTENRIAVATANEWKDANDKVMPVKQWLEERRVLMVWI